MSDRPNRFAIVPSFAVVVLMIAMCAGNGQPAPVQYANPFATGGPIIASPSYQPGTPGTVYLPSDGPGTSLGNFYAIKADLSSTIYAAPIINVFGRQGFLDPFTPSPAIGSDGTVYVVSSSDGMLYAYPSSNAQVPKWTYHVTALDGTGLMVGASPTVGLDGNIYIATDDEAFSSGFTIFQCVDPDLGLSKWKLDIGVDTDSSPAFGPNCMIYVLDESGYLHFITPYGREYPPLYVGPGTDPDTSPAFGPNGSLYVVNSGGFLVCIDSVSRTQKWTLSLGPGLSSPVANNQELYLGDSQGNFYDVHVAPNGIIHGFVLAQINLPNTSGFSSAAVASDGSVYVGTYDSSGVQGAVYSLTPSSPTFNVNWKSALLGAFYSSPLLATVGGANVVYAGSYDGNLYSYYASAGPVTGQYNWSMFHGGQKRQGSYGSGTCPPSQLINVNFTQLSNSPTKTGKAAYGNSSSDFWNVFGICAKNNQCGNTTLANARNAANQTTSVSVSIGNARGLNQTVFNDPMMNSYAATRLGENQTTITINGLSSVGFNGSAARYDLYLYGNGGTANGASVNTQFSVSPAPLNSPNSQTTTSSTGWDVNQWVEGNQYVVFRDVPVSSSGQAVVITAALGQGAFAVINGMQVVAKQ